MRLMKLGRPCNVCKSSDRDEIDRGLESREPLRKLAARFGISLSSLQRHKISLRREVSQPTEPIAQVEDPRPSHVSEIESVAASPPAIKEQPEHVPSPRPATISEQPTPDIRDPVAGALDQPPQKYTGGPLSPCPTCGEIKWRRLPDDTLSCSVCHPLPIPGSYSLWAQSGNGRLGVAKSTTGVQSPTALSSA
jgi:hypothetical protein